MIFVCVKNLIAIYIYIYIYIYILILEIKIVKSDKDLIKHGEIMWLGYYFLNISFVIKILSSN
jgi:hypothetical protein